MNLAYAQPQGKYIKFIELLGAKPFLSVAALKPFASILKNGSQLQKIKVYRDLINIYDQASVIKAILDSKLMSMSELNSLSTSTVKKKTLQFEYPKLTVKQIESIRWQLHAAKIEDKLLIIRSWIKKYGESNTREYLLSNDIIKPAQLNELIAQAYNQPAKDWTLPKLITEGTNETLNIVTESTKNTVEKINDVTQDIGKIAGDVLTDWKTWALIGGAGLVVLIVILRIR